MLPEGSIGNPKFTGTPAATHYTCLGPGKKGSEAIFLPGEVLKSSTFPGTPAVLAQAPPRHVSSGLVISSCLAIGLVISSVLAEFSH